MGQVDNHYDFRQYIAFIGDQTVGKTTLVAAFSDFDMTTSDYIPILADAVDLQVPVSIRNKKYIINLTLLDTAYPDELLNILGIELNNTSCVVACYSVVNQVSQQRLRDIWIPAIRRSNDDIPILFCGTKADLRGSATLKYSSIETMNEYLGISDSSKFVECSVCDYFMKTGENEGSLGEVLDKALMMGLHYEMKKSKSSACFIL